MSLETALSLLDELEGVGRARVEIDDIWRAYFAVDAEFAHSPHKRERLHGYLTELVDESAIRFPKAKRSFDSGLPPLPKFVRMNRPANAVPNQSEASRFPWCPELAWAATARISPDQFVERQAVHRFLIGGGSARPVVPCRERSLELFGDEKRLDALARTGMFAAGRVGWELIRCRPEHPPLVWQAVGSAPTLLVVENHHTYVSLSRTLPEQGDVGFLAYGAGQAFIKSIGSALTLPLAEGGGSLKRIWYFGDLDEAGLRIPIAAGVRGRELGLPEVEPALALYELLLEVGKARPLGRVVEVEDARLLAAWLGSGVSGWAEELLESGERIAQEWVGYERLIERPAEWWSWLGAEGCESGDDRAATNAAGQPQ